MSKYSSMVLPCIEDKAKKQLSERDFDVLFDLIEEHLMNSIHDKFPVLKTVYKLGLTKPYTRVLVEWGKGENCLMVTDIVKISKREYKEIQDGNLPIGIKIKYN